jgi:hypothetical protein
MNNNTTLRNLSRWQYGTLVWLHDNRVTEDDLRGVNMNTAWSLLHATPNQPHPLAARVRESNGSVRIALTRQGIEAMNLYRRPEPAARATERDLTERVARLLATVRVIRARAAAKAA